MLYFWGAVIVALVWFSVNLRKNDASGDGRLAWYLFILPATLGVLGVMSLVFLNILNVVLIIQIGVAAGVAALLLGFFKADPFYMLACYIFFLCLVGLGAAGLKLVSLNFN